MPFSTICSFCHQPYIVDSLVRANTRKFCSNACKWASAYTEKICPVCGTPFTVRRCRIDDKRYCSVPCSRSILRRPPEQRFWEKVSKTDTCWLWQAAINVETGYGAFWDGFQLIGAHVYAYILTFGPVPEGFQVLHHCDVRACVRNDETDSHLFSGTQADNIADAWLKGRLAIGDRNSSLIRPWRLPRGEMHYMSKLTENHVREIRSLQGIQSSTTVGKSFGVDRTTICSIWNYDNWKHVP